MNPQQFQTVIAAWLSVLVIVIPSITAVVLLVLQQIQKINTAVHQINDLQSTVNQHERRLNGQLDQRIVQAAEVVANQKIAQYHAAQQQLPSGGAGQAQP